MTDEVENQTDESLARQSQAGSLAAFEELVRRFENRIYAFVFQLCRNQTDAREITQDTFVRAFQALSQYDPRQAFTPWLFTIARHKCIDAFRARRPVAEGEAPEQADVNDPSVLLAHREDARVVWETARQILNPIQYQAVWLRYVEDLDIADVAHAIGKTQTHVKVILLRARRSLAAQLEPAEFPRESIAAGQTAAAKGGSL